MIHTFSCSEESALVILCKNNKSNGKEDYTAEDQIQLNLRYLT
jgi:hypothetical protein